MYVSRMCRAVYNSSYYLQVWYAYTNTQTLKQHTQTVNTELHKQRSYIHTQHRLTQWYDNIQNTDKYMLDLHTHGQYTH